MIKCNENFVKSVDVVLSEFVGRFIFNPLNFEEKYKIIQITNNGILYLKDKNGIVFETTLKRFKDFHIL